MTRGIPYRTPRVIVIVLHDSHGFIQVYRHEDYYNSRSGLHMLMSLDREAQLIYTVSLASQKVLTYVENSTCTAYLGTRDSIYPLLLVLYSSLSSL